MNFRRLNQTGGRLCFALLIILSGAACQIGSSSSKSTAITANPTTTTPAPTTGSSPAQVASPSTTAATHVAAAGPTNLPGSFNSLVQKAEPAVVQITNNQTPPNAFNQPAIPTGVGSGIIIDDQGHILTNNHVIAGAQQLQVSLPDGRSFTAKLIGADPQTDLAVIQISGNSLPVASIGDSSKLLVGDWVVAIGNALALEGGPTVTAGVVSALGRTVQEPGSDNSPGPFLFNVIQTDASINPGNSGGPLIDEQNQVVGINTLVAGNAEPGVQAEGIGFAISINTAMPIARELIASGSVVHPYLGISYSPLNPSIAAQLNITQTQGVIVLQVDPTSPAATAGLQEQDIITEIDGKKLVGDSDLAQALNDLKPGDVVTLTVLRNGQTQQIKATLGTPPEATPTS
jgi:S1-C subfamily serine protease